MKLSLVAAVLAALFVWVPFAPATPSYLFADEFNGAAGSLPSSTQWGAKTYKAGSGTQWNGWKNISEDGNGDLVITADKVNGTWYSGFLTGKVGYSGPRDISVRAKVSCGQGTWNSPAWEWHYPYGSGGIENDVIEQLGKQPQGYHTTLHNWTVSSDPQSGKLDGTAQTLCGGFHVYEAQVYADHIDYLFDGAKVFTASAASVGLSNLTQYQEVANVSLNMGGWGGTPGPGPYQMLVDYVRVAPLP